MDQQFNLDSVNFDWFILGLRVAFIFLIYFFLYQVARVMIRELVVLGTVTDSAQTSSTVAANSALEMLEPADSSYLSGETIPLDHYTTIGRRDSNSLQIEDSFVSSDHAEIVFDQGAWWLIDLGSRNGSFVNSIPARGRTRIANGDIVQFGRVKLRAMI
ncbi:MAG: FHA domain-containing protein [Thermomicrobiales bacterium]